MERCGQVALAAELAGRVEAAVIDGDDFHLWRSGPTWDAMSPARRADLCIDWRRKRPVLTALRNGEAATWAVHDWEADDGRSLAVPRTVAPGALVVLEGTYSARPELADLLDFRVMVDAPADLRRARLLEREGADGYVAWAARWASADEHYFAQVMPREAFDLVLDNAKNEA